MIVHLLNHLGYRYNIGQRKDAKESRIPCSDRKETRENQNSLKNVSFLFGDTYGNHRAGHGSPRNNGFEYTFTCKNTYVGVG